MTLREKFEAWCRATFAVVKLDRWRDGYNDAKFGYAWMGYQAGHAEGIKDAARRCAEIVRAWEYYGTYMTDAIKKEFPEAFTSDPPE